MNLLKFDSLLETNGKQIISSDWKDKSNVFTYPKELKSELIQVMGESVLHGDGIESKGDRNNGLYSMSLSSSNKYKTYFRSIDYDGFVEDGGSFSVDCDGYVTYYEGYECMYWDCFSRSYKYYKGRNSDASGNVTTNVVVFV